MIGKNCCLRKIHAPTEKDMPGGSNALYDSGRDEILALLGRSDALTEIAETFDRVLEAAGGKWPEKPSTGIDLQAETKYSLKDRNIIDGYLEAVDQKILEAAQMYCDDKNAKFGRFKLGDVQERKAQEIKNLLGVDVSGYTHNIDKNAFNHIEKRYGLNDDADHSMEDLNDVAHIGWVIAHYDTVELLKDEKGNQVYSEEFQTAGEKMRRRSFAERKLTARIMQLKPPVKGNGRNWGLYRHTLGIKKQTLRKLSIPLMRPQDLRPKRLLHLCLLIPVYPILQGMSTIIRDFPSTPPLSETGSARARS